MADNASPALLPLFRIGYGKDWNWELARKGGKIEDEEQHMHLSNWPNGRRVLQSKGTCDMDASVGVMGKDEGGYECLRLRLRLRSRTTKLFQDAPSRKEGKGREGKERKDDGSVCCFFPMSFSFSILVVKGWDCSILGSVTYTPMPGVDSLHTNIKAP